jgi:transcriptional regulator with XRE-family HTH domain
MEITRRLAAKVRERRRARGWSQEQLADEAGLHRTYISQVERATKNPTIEAVEKIANALGASMGELLD